MFFGEKVEFNKELNDKFEKENQDINFHFKEHEKEDEKLNAAEPDVAITIINAISSEFEKFK